MSALTEKVAREHRHMISPRLPGHVCECGGWKQRGDGLFDAESFVAHVAEVTEAAVRAAVLAEFEQHDERHWCTKACPDGCDVAVTRVWTRREVIERDEPPTEEDIAALRDRFPDLFRKKGQP